MADSLEIEARAQCKLADEYDAAQNRGEVVGAHDGAKKRVPNENAIATVTDIGLTRKQVHEARRIRDAEKREPGMVRKTLDAAQIIAKFAQRDASQMGLRTMGNAQCDSRFDTAINRMARKRQRAKPRWNGSTITRTRRARQPRKGETCPSPE
jgi:hypothetical protein